MAQEPTDTNTSRSTTYRFERRKILVRSEGARESGAEGGHRHSVSRRNMREPISITIRWRQGAESWWQIEARGKTWRRPGYTSLDDVMRDISGQ